MSVNFSAYLIDPPPLSLWEPSARNVGFNVSFSAGNDKIFPRVQTVGQLEAKKTTIDQWVETANCLNLEPVFLSMNPGSAATKEFDRFPNIELLSPDLFPNVLHDALDCPDGEWIDRYLSAMGHKVDTLSDISEISAADFCMYGRNFRVWLEKFLSNFSESERESLWIDNKSFANGEWEWHADGRSRLLINTKCQLIVLSVKRRCQSGASTALLTPEGVLQRIPKIEGLIGDSMEGCGSTISLSDLKSWLGIRAKSNDKFFDETPLFDDLAEKVRSQIAAWWHGAPRWNGMVVTTTGLSREQLLYEESFDSDWGNGYIIAKWQNDKLFIRLSMSLIMTDEPRLTLMSDEHRLKSEPLHKRPLGDFTGMLEISASEIRRLEENTALRLVVADKQSSFFELDLGVVGAQ